MQKMAATRPEVKQKKLPLADRHQATYRRMDRWLRLQQFVYGLPDDYSYAVCVKENPGSGESETHTLVRMGWMNWYGRGQSSDGQHSLAVALLTMTDAFSTNTTAVFLHNTVRRFSRFFRLGTSFRFRRREKQADPSGVRLPGELLAS